MGAPGDWLFHWSMEGAVGGTLGDGFGTVAEGVECHGALGTTPSNITKQTLHHEHMMHEDTYMNICCMHIVDV